ncbi:MAG TPA: hypothetical protein VEU08_08640 [Vicinamibacterales bacterium]|nr:hypothetical protein [Vicinamibacterales bacterium]
MKIEPDVYRVASTFGLDASLLQAIVDNEEDIVRAVQCAVQSVSTRSEALQITARSAVHAMCDYIKSGAAERQDDFIRFWSRRWSSFAAEDPKEAALLKAGWKTNVDQWWVHRNDKKKDDWNDDLDD